MASPKKGEGGTGRDRADDLPSLSCHFFNTSSLKSPSLPGPPMLLSFALWFRRWLVFIFPFFPTLPRRHRRKLGRTTNSLRIKGSPEEEETGDSGDPSFRSYRYTVYMYRHASLFAAAAEELAGEKELRGSRDCLIFFIKLRLRVDMLLLRSRGPPRPRTGLPALSKITKSQIRLGS